MFISIVIIKQGKKKKHLSLCNQLDKISYLMKRTNFSHTNISIWKILIPSDIRHIFDSNTYISSIYIFQLNCFHYIVLTNLLIYIKKYLVSPFSNILEEFKRWALF